MKTWETLFNLSSFMKYLLAEVLPDENIDSPSYVLNSLKELLEVTAACIEKIKSELKFNNHNQNTKNDNLVGHGVEVPSFRTFKKDVEENNTFPKSKKRYSSSESLFGKNISTTSHSVSHGKIANYNISKLEWSQSKKLSEKFIKLSDEMHNGRSLGHYCRPCDVVIFSKELWGKHHSYNIHVELNDNCENKHTCCSFCNLIIFAGNIDSEELFTYHLRKHVDTELSPQNANNIVDRFDFEDSVLNKASSLDKYNYERSIHAEKINNSLDLEIKAISATFVELDKKMHSGMEQGFYCFPCDMAFDSRARWNKHFQVNRFHSNQAEASECFEICESCHLVMFAASSVQTIYKKYHLLGHGDKERNVNYNQIDITRSTDDIHTNLTDTNSLEHLSSSESITNSRNQTSNNFYIVKKFERFNFTIHSSNLHGSFYCRPCNACILTGADWTEHALQEKHLQLMESLKFKNWKGRCNYCFLTILGTREIVKYYMQFHTIDHKQPLSYEEKIDEPQQKAKNRFTHRSKTSSLSYSASTLNDEDGTNASITDEYRYPKVQITKQNNGQFLNFQPSCGEDKNGNRKDIDTSKKNNKFQKEPRKKGKKGTSIALPSLELSNKDINIMDTNIVEPMPLSVCNDIKLEISSEKNIENNKSFSINDGVFEESFNDDQDSLILQFINSKMEQKQKTDCPEFGGLCLLCKISIDSAFSWEDHISFDGNHKQKVSSKDLHASVNELNVRLFGNSDVLMKYKTLVQGNLIFIK